MILKKKKQIWGNIRGKLSLKYVSTNLQIFADLSQETLRRRRLLKSLLELMQNHDIRYNWGFPSCLVGCKDGHMAKLRFQEELRDFCKKLEIVVSDIPGWTGVRIEKQHRMKINGY